MRRVIRLRLYFIAVYRLCRSAAWVAEDGTAAANQAEQGTNLPNWRRGRYQICINTLSMAYTAQSGLL